MSIPSIIKDQQISEAKILAEALPYMKKFAGETFVIKFGGNAMINDDLTKNFAKDIVMLKQVGINPIVVHGGGPQINLMLKKLNIESKFIDGMRVTNQDSIDIVEMVLSGPINKRIVSEINKVGGLAVGISGKDGDLIESRKLRHVKSDPDSNVETILDLGFVGEPTVINPEILIVLEESNIIPVIAPISFGINGETFNNNADSVASSIASSLVASKLIILTDVPGVMDQNNNLLSNLTINQANEYISNGTISGGMIPKVSTAINAVKKNTDAAHIIDGRIDHILLLEIFTNHGTGTMITPF